MSGWRPIDPPSEQFRDQVADEVERLDHVRDLWAGVRAELSDELLSRFTERLYRSVAIETGIIEGLYELDRGITETIVAHGITADAIERAGGTISANTLDLIRDQRESLDFVMDYVGGTRELTEGFTKELHALITRHQEFVEGVDQFGRRVRAPLRHGLYKLLPNNPTRPNGTVHEYAPPEQTGAEMSRLIEIFQPFGLDFHPVAAAAWLHHAFAAIHPFQDGNGRVARALASMILIKGDYFPLRVDREDRDEYITALEEADAGTLLPLTNLFAKLQRRDLLRAVSEAAKAVTEDVTAADPDRSKVDQVASALAVRHRAREMEQFEDLRKVNSTAAWLYDRANDTLEQKLADVSSEFERQRLDLVHWVRSAGPGDREEDYWWFQIVNTAKRLGHWANRSEDRYWVQANVSFEKLRLVYVVSLHHVGSPLSGVMAGTCFGEIWWYNEDEEPAVGPDKQAVNCSDTAFTFTVKDRNDQVLTRFNEWIDESLAVALHVFGAALQ